MGEEISIQGRDAVRDMGKFSPMHEEGDEQYLKGTSDNPRTGDGPEVLGRKNKSGEYGTFGPKDSAAWTSTENIPDSGLDPESALIARQEASADDEDGD